MGERELLLRPLPEGEGRGEGSIEAQNSLRSIRNRVYEMLYEGTRTQREWKKLKWDRSDGSSYLQLCLV